MNEVEFRNTKVGVTRVKVIDNHLSGHSYTMGKVYKVTRISGRGLYLDGNFSYADPSELEIVIASRNEELKSLKETIEAMRGDILVAEERIAWLSQYKDNLDEAVKKTIGKLGITFTAEETKAMYLALKEAGINPNFTKEVVKLQPPAPTRRHGTVSSTTPPPRSFAAAGSSALTTSNSVGVQAALAAPFVMEDMEI